MKNPANHNWKGVSSALLDEQAEGDLLGYMILALDNPALAECSAQLFGSQTHRKIAAAILHLVEHRIVVDFLEVLQELCRRGLNPGAAYISDLTRGVVLACPPERRIAYPRELRQPWKLATLAESLAERASNLADPLPAIVAAVLESVQ